MLHCYKKALYFIIKTICVEKCCYFALDRYNQDYIGSSTAFQPGHNTIVVVKGANEELSVREIESVEDIIKASKVFIDVIEAIHENYR